VRLCCGRVMCGGGGEHPWALLQPRKHSHTARHPLLVFSALGIGKVCLSSIRIMDASWSRMPDFGVEPTVPLVSIPVSATIHALCSVPGDFTTQEKGDLAFEKMMHSMAPRNLGIAAVCGAIGGG
jgi:hypothetical protein